MSQIVPDSVVVNSTENLSKIGSSYEPSKLTRNKDERWEKVLANAFKDPIKLLEFLQLDSLGNIEKVQLDSKFKMLVPVSYANKMKKGDWQDPLFRQVLPLKEEGIQTTGFVNDPVGDLQAEVSPGVLHKYQGRILIVTTGACPVHCRYCFRREFPYVDSNPDKKHWQNTLARINNDKSIQEVIFSGGDPLMLSDTRLKKMCTEIASISHVTTIRFHTRVPIFLPERITPEFLTWLGELKVNKVMVIHCNHSNELDDKVGEGLLALRNHGVTLLNQAVLLKGVNDSVETLKSLLQHLFSYQVLPYYLHQLDKVKGSSHFEVDRDKALDLIESLKIQMPGYLIPRLVEELSGERSKLTIVKNQD
ncbi:UNVERIFIED_CONTAM: hypothetical protein GTU68_021763 [Idotea baltica]|nr:hypothetical protein [Idotea baltica]